MRASNATDAAIEVILNQLPSFSIKQLRERWQSLFRTRPPPAFGPDLLRRSIAQRLQETAFGELSPRGQRELDRIIALVKKSPAARLEIPRRIKAGSVLVRDWKGKMHCVTVLDDGFGYDGHSYASLSEIACDITGTHWNGPRFFGLRPNAKKPVNDGATKPRSRPTKRGFEKKPEASHGL